MEKFYFETPTLDRKEEALAYIQEHADSSSNINGTGGLDRCLKGMTYEKWLDDVNNCRNKEYAEEQNKVPATTFFTIRESDNKIVGMVNLRHYLNDELRRVGGHIGYGIRPSERRKGYAKIQLYLALVEAQKIGLDRVMVTCVNTNEPSDRTINALGGIFDREEWEEEENSTLNVYWINVNDSLEKYSDEYSKFIAINKTYDLDER